MGKYLNLPFYLFSSSRRLCILEWFCFTCCHIKNFRRDTLSVFTTDNLSAIQSTKVFGNFDLKLNGSVKSNRKSFEKNRSTFSGGPRALFTVGPVWSKWTVSFQPILNPSILRCSVFPCPKMEENTYHCNFYGSLTADLSVLRVPSMRSYNRSVAASQAKRMFWLLTALEDDLFPEPIWMFFSSFESGVWTHPANVWERSTQNNLLYWLNYHAWSSSHDTIGTVEIVI